MTIQFAGSRASVARATGSKLIAGSVCLASMMIANAAMAQSLGYASPSSTSFPSATLMLAPSPSLSEDEVGQAVLPARLRRAVVALNSRETPGTVIIDTGNTALYYVLGQGRAIRYGVGVGRDGFTWSGVQKVSRKAEWPDWYPPAEMIARQPYLPRFVAGGTGNPLGARAIYLGSSQYRIHGTNDPSTIGKFVSSGCIRMTNEDVSDLFSRVDVGTRVVVLAKNALHPEAGPETKGAMAIGRAPASSRTEAIPFSRHQAMNVSIY